jgi:hypothetical protein
MKVIVKKGTESLLVDLEIFNSDGAPLTTLAHDSAGLTAKYKRKGGTWQAVVLADATLGQYTSGGFKHSEDGIYEFGIPNAALEAGSDSVTFKLNGVDGMRQQTFELQLVDFDLYQETVTVGTNNDKTGYSVDVLNDTVVVDTNLDKLGYSVDTVNDKEGYSLTQTFPTNFEAMAITAGGAVTVGTNNDKTEYSLTQTFPDNFSALSITAGGAVTAGTVSDKEGYSLALTDLEAIIKGVMEESCDTVEDTADPKSLARLLMYVFNKSVLDTGTSQVTVYKAGGEVAAFTQSVGMTAGVNPITTKLEAEG